MVNGFGISLGDAVIGLQALHVAQRSGAVQDPRPVLYRRPGARPMIEAFHALAADFAQPRPFPVGLAPERDAPLALPEPFDRVIDLRDFAFDPSFRGVAMVDWFLGRLGVDPAQVAGRDKRNAWLRPRVALPPGRRGNYALVCPNASMPQRDMPPAALGYVLAWLQRHAPWPARVAPGDMPSPEALCACVADAALVVSTDTAMVHLADAFDVPCLAVFTTHRPEWRARDYPRCVPVHRPVAGLPEALEFADPAQVAASQAAWFDTGASLAWLGHALGRVTRMAGAESPGQP